MAMGYAERGIITARVIERYNEDAPSGGLAFKEWSKAVAKDLGLPDRDVRAAVAEYTNGYLREVRLQSLTYAQRVAETMGASVMTAMATLDGGMKATKVRFVSVGKGANADVVKKESPDWPARITAATRVLDIHGSWAPKQVEVHSRNENFNYSDAELYAKLQDLTKEIAAALPTIAGTPAQVAGGAVSRGGVQVPPGAEGLLLLDDGMHANGGRAERDPVQAVPEGALHSKSRRRPAKRISHPDGKK